MRPSRLGSVAVSLAWMLCGRVDAESECPASITVITVERAIHVGLQPVYISAFFSVDTVIEVQGTDIAITNAPTTFVSKLTLTNTTISTIYQ